MMRRFLLSGLTFLGIGIVLYVLTFLVLCRTQVGSTPSILRSNNYYAFLSGTDQERFEGFDTTRRYDVVVLGSSHAYRGYDPALFAARGWDLHVLGSSAQTAMHGHYLLRDLLPSGRTGLLIIDLYAPTTWMQDGLESTSLLTRNLPWDRTARSISWAQQDLRAWNMWMLRLIGTNERPLPADTTCRSGYCPQPDSLHRAVQPVPPRAFTPLPHQLEHFRRMLALADERGIPTVLVTHYLHGSSDRALHEAFHRQVMEELRAYPHIRYIDLAYGHAADDRHHFHDQGHLNQAGVDLFNDQLMDSLVTLGLLPHARADR